MGTAVVFPRTPFWYPKAVKSSVSIVLFFLLSGFFLSILLGVIEHSGRLLLASGACLAAVVCIIVFLTPVEWPSWHLGWGGDDGNAAVTSTMSTSTSSTSSTSTSSTSTTIHYTVTTEVSGGARR